jgi:hypothetical protein
MGKRRLWALAGVAVPAGLAGSAASAADDPLLQGVARHLATFRAHPPERIVGL